MRISPLIWLLITTLALVFNFLGLLRLVPIFITMPILFIAIYFTIFSFTHQKTFKGLR
ncbi:hypothetical protein [Pontibacillus litoralis]|uniref:Uncharacterized protein n=1 Tax=Pontibacillus litoralis JSM 072002 TaxID=1385512 RepID=A0A0A5HVP3_9BACI|nr:hypothetical protein [Pontibacillus litoralis]KGX87717.1 hypothetical protein N784_13955 [Pontibacillus litoralis JSM 072002]